MADFKLQGTLEFGTANAVRNINQFNERLGKTGQTIRSFGSEVLQNLGTQFAQLGAAMTGSIAGAVAIARKELPEVQELLKDVSDSFNVMATSVTKAVIPSMKDFRDLMEGVAGVVKGFAERHGEIIRQFLRYGVIISSIGALAFALGGLARVIGLVTLLFTKLGIVTLVLNPIFLTVAGVMAALVAVVFALTKIFPQLGTAIQTFSGNVFAGFLKITGLQQKLQQFNAFLQQMRLDFETGAKRTTNIFDQFVLGIRSGLNDLNANIQKFAEGIRGSFEAGFSDVIFDTITGKIQGLREVMLKFADDVLRAFSRFASNQFLSFLFGDNTGNAGVFGGIFGGLFRRGGSGGGNTTNQQQINNTTINNFGRQIDRTADKFGGLQRNMDLFARAKDDVIDRLRQFRSALGGGAGGGAAGGIAGAAGGAVAALGEGTNPISDKVLESVGSFNELLAVTQGFVENIVEGWKNMQKETIKQGITFAITTAAMLAVSAVAAAAAVAISGAAAAALAAAWAPAAIAASIATFGVAAAVGLSSYIAAVGTGTAATGQLSSAGASQFPGNISIGNTGGTPLGIGAEGGIVTRPTLAVIGEAGPEAVVPLNRTPGSSPLGAGGGSRVVNINIDTAVLNDPSNMDRFMRKLREELARA